jgi:exodeoxyribonuclease-5
LTEATLQASPPTAPQPPQLNDEQQLAFDSILTWLKDPHAEKFFILRGYAGTGKTFTTKSILSQVRGRVVFTAPTNKATKVLRETLRTKDYLPECRTIYSLLGLKMEASGEVKELARPEEDIDLTQYALVVVDESGMLNEQVIGYMKEAAETFNLKFLCMGDAAQLPPVKEPMSKIWKISDQIADLTKVMRHDNQILTLATALRQKVGHPAPMVSMKSDNDGEQGVWALTLKQMEAFIADEALIGGFHNGTAKVIAWRNVTVDKWNAFIRRQVYTDADSTPWFVGERVIFTSPAKDLDDEIKATTDDEGLIQSVAEDWHPIYGEFKTFRISVILDDSKMVIARVLHPAAQAAWNRKSEELADAARADKRRWRQFWEFKDAFHNLRHAYAITAHRSQGSTYETAFVEYKDILINRDRQESFRCLYTACTRPKKELYLA